MSDPRTIYIAPVFNEELQQLELVALDAARDVPVASLEVPDGVDPLHAAPDLKKTVLRVCGPDTRVFWVPTPEAHPVVARILKEQAATEPAADEPAATQPTSDELRALNDRAHICRACSHAAVCSIASAIRAHGEALATVVGCLEFRSEES